MYCSKDGYNHLHERADHSTDGTLGYSTRYYKAENVRGWGIEPAPLNSNVVFKFRCYKVEMITYDSIYKLFKLNNVLQNSCLKEEELFDYLKGKNGFAIYISDLEIFDKPKELSKFYKVGHYEDLDDCFTDEKQINGEWCIPIKKAPQNFTYINIDKREEL